MILKKLLLKSFKFSKEIKQKHPPPQGYQVLVFKQAIKMLEIARRWFTTYKTDM